MLHSTFAWELCVLGAVTVNTDVEWLLAPEVSQKDANEVSLPQSPVFARPVSQQKPQKRKGFMPGVTRTERILQSFQACSDDAAVVCVVPAPAHVWSAVTVCLRDSLIDFAATGAPSQSCTCARSSIRRPARPEPVTARTDVGHVRC